MKPLFPEPLAKEDKPSFDTLPSPLLRDIEYIVSDRIIGGKTAYGGLSASASFIIELASGRKIFTKGSHPLEMAHGTQQLRQESFIYKSCGVLKNISPAYLGEVGDTDEDGWLLGLWEYVPVTDTPPLEGVIKSLVSFQQDKATVLNDAAQQNYISMFFDNTKKWKRLQDEPATADKFLTLFKEASAKKWLAGNIQKLVALQNEEVTGHVGLLHGDLRLDNFLCDGTKTFVIDWPNACRGPLIFDLVFLFANLEALGVYQIEDSFAIYKTSGGKRFSYSEKSVMAVKIAGFFADQAYRAVPEKLPRLRWMQKGILLALLGYLYRLGISDSIPPMTGQNP